MHTKTSQDDSNPAKGLQRRMDFPLDLIIAMRLVLRPIALIAMMMRNLESCLRGEKKLLLTLKEVRTVVSREARIK